MALMRTRRSVRLFTGAPVARETIQRVVEAGRFAPTGGNLQALRYAVAEGPERVARIRTATIAALAGEGERMTRELDSKAAPGTPAIPADTLQRTYADLFREMAEFAARGVDRLFYGAPALVVVHANRQASASNEVDAGLAAMQMVLMAETLGLGTCLIGFVPLGARLSADVTRELELPKGHVVLTAFVVGYPDVTYRRLVARRPARVRWLG